ncbi:MAG: VanW family protein [Chloroflexi bacterium]|nr:VanW family protein [Chloroflexota bacterium]
MKRPRVRRRGLPRWILPLGAIASLLFLLVVFFAAYQVLYRDRVIQGVSVQRQPIQGLTRDQAREFLERQFGQPDAILARFGGEPLVLRAGDQSWRAYPWELGMRTDFGPVAEAAIRLGHQGSIPGMLAEQARCALLGCELGSAAQFDVQTAQAYLGWLAPQVDRPARDASLQIDGLTVVATPAEEGRELDGATMLERIQQRILSGDRSDIPIAFRDVQPLLSDVSAAKARAEAILAAPVMLTFNGHAWAVDQAALASMISIQTVPDADGKLSLTVGLDHTRLVAFLAPLARDIDQPARDARFHFDPTSGSLTTVIPSQYGQKLDPEETAKQIETQVQTMASRVPGLASPLDSATVRTIGLPVTLTKPTIAMEDASKFGIKELVAQGVSNFRGSAAGRIQNIQTATTQFEGIVIPPGGTFSFDQNLGDVVEANGYDDAYVIFADRTILGPGGGVCQVSTTLFRAAFWGGYPIVERWAHAYRVGYYEPPVGLDATVFSPVVDFKFKNDGDTYLLIQTQVDLKTTTLTFNLYGTKPNRTVEMEDPVVENLVPHGPAIYTDDPSLKKGVVKQVDTAHDGEDVTIYRKILVNGQLVKRDRFFSRYEPWVARYQVGTKP